MSRKDLIEPWNVIHLREWVKDSLCSHGEEAIALSMYHVADDQDTVERCPQCYDDIYKQSADPTNCTQCYGTTFNGGVKQMARVWVLFTDTDNDENYRREGIWANNARQLQMEFAPVLTEHDYVIRVAEWTRDHRPKGIEGIYSAKVIDPTSLRTGEGHGDTARDIVGQRTNVNRVPDDAVIYKLPVIGQVIPRLDGKQR